jgi:glutathione S-transferase
MKLYYNPPSPYGRKVLVVAHEKQLSDQLLLCAVDPWGDPAELLAATPLGKVPALVLDDGTLIADSTTIAEYLDSLSVGPSLIRHERFVDVSARAALAHGLIDAAFAMVIERRRPADRQWSAWIDRQRRAIERTVAKFAPQPNQFDLGDITLACGLAYIDFRLPDIPWRKAQPALARWLDEISQRPSMRATAPQ